MAPIHPTPIHWIGRYHRLCAKVRWKNKRESVVYRNGTFAIISTDRSAGIAGKFRGEAWGLSPKIRGGDIGVYIPPIFRKYYYKLTVFSNDYRRHVTLGIDL